MRTRSFIRELDSLHKETDPIRELEKQLDNAYSNVMKVFELINATCGEEMAEEMRKRFISSINRSDPKKIELGLKKLKEKRDADTDT